MDYLYVGDIPTEFSYAVYGSNYVTLYAQSSARNEVLPYYRVYLNYNGFYYSSGTTTFGNTTTTFDPIKTTNNWLYRSDIDKIFVVSFICILLFIFIFNIVTSVFKKGGVFGGLL